MQKTSLKFTHSVLASLFLLIPLLATGTFSTGHLTILGETKNGLNAVPDDLGPVKAIWAGYEYTVVIKEDGTAFGWGAFPIYPLPSGLNLVALSNGNSPNHVIGITEEGELVGWGNNQDNSATPPEGLGSVMAVSGGLYFTVALKTDGTVVAWGKNSAGQTDVPEGLSNVIDIFAGDSHALAVKSDGTVVAWGKNLNGQTDVPDGLTGVTSVVATQNGSLALKADGTIVGWGFLRGLPDESELVDIAAIDASEGFIVALKTDGTVVAWGDNTYGQTDIPEGLDEVVAIDCGYAHTVAGKADGSIVVWGFEYLEPPEDLQDIVSVDRHQNHTTIALKSDGTVIGWGRNTYGQLNFPDDLTDITVISIGTISAAAIKADGSIVAWGSGGYGELDIPQDLGPVTDIAHGWNFLVALKANGTVAAWGENTFGGLNVPDGLTNVIEIAADGDKVIALKEDGTVAAWGGSDGNEVIVPEGLSEVIAVSASDRTLMALKADGSIVSWDGSSEISNNLPPAPDGLEGVASISAGVGYAHALMSNGTVVGWSNWGAPQTSIPEQINGHVTGIFSPAAVTFLITGPQYGPFFMEDGGFVNTDDWMGWLNVLEAPWIWSYNDNNWYFFPDTVPDNGAGWVYIVDPTGGSASSVVKWGAYAITDLAFADTDDWLGWLDIQAAPWVYSYNNSRWFYIPDAVANSAGGWIYVTAQ